MKYSFIIPYYDRCYQFERTLESYKYHYFNRKDFDIMVLEDKKNHNDEDFSNRLSYVIDKFPSLNINRFKMQYNNFCCPCSTMNWAVDNCNSKYVILTSPEIFHVTNVLSVFDSQLEQVPDAYVVAACKPFSNPLKNTSKIIEDFVISETGKWYQHSIYAGRGLFFCSVISKDGYIKVKGFNENYDVGAGRADSDFIRRLSITHKIKIIQRDDAVTIHQFHPRIFASKDLVNKNSICTKFKSRFK